MPEDSYAELIGRLATAKADHAAKYLDVWEWYAQQCTAAEVAAAQADQDVVAAEAKLETAESLLEFTRQHGADLWWRLARRLRLRNPLRLGPPPGPSDGPPPEEHPGRTLDRLRDLLDEAEKRGRRRWRSS